MEYTFSNPAFNGVSAKQFSFDVPDEGKLFKDGAGNILVIKGGQVYSFVPEQGLADIYGLGSISSTGDSPATKWTNWLRSQGLSTGGAVQNRAYQELGIDFNKLPEYNIGDIHTYLSGMHSQKGTGQPFTMNIQKITANEIKDLYNKGEIMGQAGKPTERDLTGAEAPKLITGAQGPVLADGTPIKPEDYAKYGITNNQIAPSQTQQNAQGATQMAGGLPPIQDPATGKYYENLGGGKLGKEVPAPTAGGTTGTIPGYKGIYAGKEQLSLNKEAVNELFTQYHNRDANAQELSYWTTKKVGELEDTLAKTSIFSKEEADKIRAEMMKQGKTYIANQAELENLARSGGLSEDVLTRVGGQTGMMFAPTSQIGASAGATTGGAGTTSGTSGATGATTGATGATGTGGDLIDEVVDATGNPNASDEEILDALEKLKTGQIDPYYKQLISQAQSDVVRQINRTYEDRIRQLQTESFDLAENIRGAQKSLEARGMTFSGEAVKQLGTLSAFAQPSPQALTPAQLGQETPVPTMTPEQMGIEGYINMQNRLYAESSRSNFNRTLENIGQDALRLLGTQGVAGLGLPTQATQDQPTTTGTMQYNYANTLQNLYGNLAGQEQGLTDYNKLFL